MKATSFLAISLAAAAFLAANGAQARGCLTGAAAGGVVGHVAGHHAVLGAAAGCAINHHRDTVKDRKAAAAQQTQRPATAATPVPATPPR